MPHTRKGGIGVYFPHNDFYNVSLPVTHAMLRQYALQYPTNQNAELLAMLHALFTACTMHGKQVRHATIFSDSMYAINVCSLWIDKWKRKGWKKQDGTAILNKQIIQHISDVLHQCGDRITFDFIHVKAHQQPPPAQDQKQYYRWHGNATADDLAKKGAR